jgi:hypothetical protein
MIILTSEEINEWSDYKEVTKESRGRGDMRAEDERRNNGTIEA